MAPAPKKSKLTMASSSIASSSKPGPPPAIKAPKPARKEETLSDLEDEEDDQSMDGSDGGEFSDEDEDGEMGDEFDLGGGQRDGVEDYDTEDEIERVANDQGGPEKSKKTASEYMRSLC